MATIQSDSGNSQEVDLNIVPVIDCFTVLITYLLVAASFLSLSALEVETASSSDLAPMTTAEPPASLVIDLLSDKTIKIQSLGGPLKGFQPVVIPKNGKDWDWGTFNDRLQKIQKRWPSITDVTVNAEKKVIYKDLVRSVEGAKAKFKKVYLAENHEIEVR